MTKEIFTTLIENKLYLQLCLISVSCVIDMFILCYFSFMVLKVRVGFREIFPLALLMALFNFFMHQYLHDAFFFSASLILWISLLVNVGRVKVLEACWTSLLMFASSNLGPIIIFCILFFIDQDIMNFLINTTTGYTFGPLIEALIPLVGIILLTRKPTISLIPPIISKRLDFYDALGLITYGTMAFLLFFSSIQLYDSLKTSSRDTFLNMMSYFSSAVIIVTGHISIVHALKKRFESQLFKLQEEKADLEKREADLQQKITEFKQMEIEFQQEKAELVTEVSNLRVKLQEILPTPAGEEIPLHKIQDMMFDVKIKLDDLDRVFNSIAKEKRRQTPTVTGELPPCNLTPQERKLIKGLCKGRIYKEIAPELNFEEKTVRNMAITLRRKLGVKNNKELVSYAVRHGLDQD